MFEAPGQWPPLQRRMESAREVINQWLGNLALTGSSPPLLCFSLSLSSSVVEEEEEEEEEAFKCCHCLELSLSLSLYLS